MVDSFPQSESDSRFRMRSGTTHFGAVDFSGAVGDSRSHGVRESLDVEPSDRGRDRSIHKRSQTWQAEPHRSDTSIDDWGRAVENYSEYQAWSFEGRRLLMKEVANSGGWRRWLLPSRLQLDGMDGHHLMSLRWLMMPANLQRQADDNADWDKRREVIEEIEKDLARTCPKHPLEETVKLEVRDILTMFCGARHLDSGYAQGMNFVAALLCGIIGPFKMTRNDAFWCFTALLEYALPHLFRGGTLYGALVDFQVLQWLIEQLSPELARHLSEIPGYSPAFVFSRPVCTILANCDLPGDAIVQIWQAILHSPLPRVQFLRSIAALFSIAAPVILSEDEADLRSVTEALRSCFESTYEISAVIDFALEGTKAISDDVVLSQIENMEKRQSQEDASERRRRARLAANRLSGGSVPLLGSDGLLRRLRSCWHPRLPSDNTSGEEFGKLIVDAGKAIRTEDVTPNKSRSSLTSFANDAERLFAELDDQHVGAVPFIQALLSLARLLGKSERERIAALFIALDEDGTVSSSSFEQLVGLCDEINDVERARQMFFSLDTDGNGVLSEREFERALLALPSLAATLMEAGGLPRDSSRWEDPSMNVRLRPLWVSAASLSSNTCQTCEINFTCWRRQHHCRACGQLVCSDCSQYRLPLLVLGYANPVRICKLCNGLLCPSSRTINS